MTDKQAVFMDVALTIAFLGTCDRKKVGVVIVRDGRCVSWGYNGAPPGLPHCEENNHGWGWEHGPKHGSDMGCRNATHAEANALAFAARQGISTDGTELFASVSPCETCARLIIAAGIIRVYYHEEYRKDDGIRLLTTAGIESLKL